MSETVPCPGPPACELGIHPHTHNAPISLDGLARRYGTDKGSGGHNYTPVYERFFTHLRDRPITLLEYGVGGYQHPDAGGESLRMWTDWMPKATVIGVDCFPKTLRCGERVRIYQGDQTDIGLTHRLVEDYGPFDIVIDDASHNPQCSIATFQNTWPCVRSGGFYVCEDLAPQPEAIIFFAGLAGMGGVVGGRYAFIHFTNELAIVGKP